MRRASPDAPSKRMAEVLGSRGAPAPIDAGRPEPLRGCRARGGPAARAIGRRIRRHPLAAPAAAAAPKPAIAEGVLRPGPQPLLLPAARACAPRASRRAARRGRRRPWARASCAPRPRAGRRRGPRRRPGSGRRPGPRRCERARPRRRTSAASSRDREHAAVLVVGRHDRNEDRAGHRRPRARARGRGPPTARDRPSRPRTGPSPRAVAAASRTDGCSAPEITTRPRRPAAPPRRSPERWTRCRPEVRRISRGARREQPRDVLPGLFDDSPRPLSLGVDGRRVSVDGSRRLSMTAQTSGSRACRGVVVEVNHALQILGCLQIIAPETLASKNFFRGIAVTSDRELRSSSDEGADPFALRRRRAHRDRRYRSGARHPPALGEGARREASGTPGRRAQLARGLRRADHPRRRKEPLPAADRAAPVRDFKEEFWQRREQPGLPDPLGPGYRNRYESFRQAAATEFEGLTSDAGRVVVLHGESRRSRSSGTATRSSARRGLDLRQPDGRNGHPQASFSSSSTARHSEDRGSSGIRRSPSASSSRPRRA